MNRLAKLLVIFLIVSEVVMCGEKIVQIKFADDGVFPNSDLPVLYYKQFFKSDKVSGDAFEKLFKANGWHGFWRNGVYKFHHYHSTAHEVLGIFAGSAEVQLGGDKGQIVKVSAGDAVLIPAGVSHKLIKKSKDLAVIGGYPPKQMWDMKYGKTGERPKADENISKVPMPKTDPLYGEKKGLCKIWVKKKK